MLRNANFSTVLPLATMYYYYYSIKVMYLFYLLLLLSLFLLRSENIIPKIHTRAAQKETHAHTTKINKADRARAPADIPYTKKRRYMILCLYQNCVSQILICDFEKSCRSHNLILILIIKLIAFIHS